MVPQCLVHRFSLLFDLKLALNSKKKPNVTDVPDPIYALKRDLIDVLLVVQNSS